jgi:RNA polymerase sigma-70 factor (ECF subfamily)
MEPNGGVGSVHGVGLTFDQFWTTQRDRIARALALTIGDADLATDAVDEAMARAYQRWHRVGTLDHPGGWVYRVALNWTRSLHRRRRRTPPVWLVSPDDSTDDYGLDPSIDRAVAALPETQRAVVVCRLLLGWSEAQTAAALDVRPGTVKSRLSRALDDLALALHHLDPSEEPR